MSRIATLFFFTLTSFFLSAQSSMPVLNSWLDDEHFILQKRNGNESNYVKVSAKTQKEVAYELEVPATFTSLMPEGYSASRRYSHISADEKSIVFPQNNDLYFFSKVDQKIRQLTSNQAEEKNPRFSPDGKKVAFTRDRNLFVIELDSGLEKQLTTDGGGLIYNGWASWVYYEEILGRGSNYRAFYWSPDSEKIAFLRFDDATVPNFPFYHHEGDDSTHGYLEMTSYPKSGDPNPLVELKFFDLKNNKLTTVEKNGDLEYLAMVNWSANSDFLFFQQLNRDQNDLRIYKANLATGKSTQVYQEQQKTWVDWMSDIYFLKKSNGFILRSNKEDWFNLYHYNFDGKLVHQITKHDFRVFRILEVDEHAEKLYYSASGKNPTESHLFVVNLNGKNQKQLTTASGTHRVTLSPSNEFFVDRFSSYNNPGELLLLNTQGKKLKTLGKSTRDPNKEKGFTVEFFTIPSTDGFDLPAYWVLPPNFDKTKKYPVIFSIYGGPDAGSVWNSYRNHTWNPIFEEGVIKFVVDHRASGKFGKKGLNYMHRSLGKWEMHDYIESVKWLRKQPFIDDSRIGITGGSYGGYMSAMALTYAADYFTHGIAALSVTDWRLYDNVYTERYMDEPKDNPEGYQFGAVMTHADKLKGRLLIVHGAIDDNVHLQNSMQLISKLQDLGKDFEMMIYPGNRHGIRGAKGRHNQMLGLKFWRESFFGSEEKVTRP
ncbi:MAG: DPP IV N-terminal domain-containing protein [Bacteroidota bacterium]